MFLAGAIVLFTVQLVAPMLPPFVGPPDISEGKRLSLPGAERLRVVNTDGPIRVTTGAQGTESIEVMSSVRVYVRDDTDLMRARQYAESLVVARGDGATLEIITEPATRPPGFELVASYDIRVPLGTDIEIIGPNGNVSIAEGCGQVAVMGGNSDIEIRRPSGTVTAKSDNGRIRLYDGVENAELEAVNGSIYANMENGGLRALTTNGHIVTTLLTPRVDYCDLRTQNGSITVAMSGASPFSYEAKTGRGIIRSDFSLDSHAPGVLDAKHVEGTVSGGGVVLTLETLNGNIWFKRKQS